MEENNSESNINVNSSSTESTNKNLRKIIILTRIPYIIYAINVVFIVLALIIDIISNSNDSNLIIALPLISFFFNQYFTIPISAIALILCIREYVKNKSNIKKYVILNAISLVYAILKIDFTLSMIKGV